MRTFIIDDYLFTKWPLQLQIFSLWVLSKFFFLVITYIGRIEGTPLLYNFFMWDGRWYWEIATQGYQFTSIYEESSVAFPPFFSFLGYFFSLLLSPFLHTYVDFPKLVQVGLVIIVQISSLVSVLLFSQLLTLHFPKKMILPAVALLIFSPIGWVLTIAYTESLFLCFTIGAWILTYRRKYFLASLLVGLAMGTRINAYLSLIILLPAILRADLPLVRKIIYSFMPFTFLFLWLLYMALYIGSFFTPFETISHAWWRGLAPYPLALSFHFIYAIKAFIIGGSFLYSWVSRIPTQIDFLLIIFLSSVVFLKTKFLPQRYRMYVWISSLWVLSVPAHNDSMFVEPTLSLLRYLVYTSPFIAVQLVLSGITSRRFFWEIILALHFFYLVFSLNELYVP